jgi:hypothetical protein
MCRICRTSFVWTYGSNLLQHGSFCSLEFSGHGNKAKENNLLLSDESSNDEYKSKTIRFGFGVLYYALWTQPVEANVSISLELASHIKSNSKITCRTTMASSSLPNRKLILFEVPHRGNKAKDVKRHACT